MCDILRNRSCVTILSILMLALHRKSWGGGLCCDWVPLHKQPGDPEGLQGRVWRL